MPSCTPFSLDALDKLGREVQTGSGRRSGVLLAHGVDGLVLLGVALVLGDVGRQRHVPRGVDGLVEREGGARGGIDALRVEADKTAALRLLSTKSTTSCPCSTTGADSGA